MGKLGFRVLLPVLSLITVSLFAGGCLNATQSTMTKPAPAESVDARLVTANTGLGFNLFAELNKRDPGQNILISPASVSIALAMTYNGADGETKEAMARTLGLQGMSMEELNRANAGLKTILENPDPEVKLTIANSIWAREGIDFKPEFMQRNRDYYTAEVETLDFSHPGASDTINKWVKKNTGGKIDKIVERIDGDILILINAVYFKGDWADKFDKSETRDGLFNLPDGTQKKHPLMSRTGRYGYYQGDNFQAVRIPYGSKRVSMYVFLPVRESSLVEFSRSLSAENWEKWMPRFTETTVHLVLPRFKFAYEVSLNDTLKALGMEIAFDSEQADFGNMCPIPPVPVVYINEVKHKTFIDVNEEGTEAAAATSVELKCAGIPQVTDMVVDRPFFFAIRDDQTGTILFMGSVLEPQT
ncbi:serpin family protein [Desulfoscipio gibsoniae]|uniref:Serine protease inhibitor n=1 Tax=Desulfoscipio gibsoniae DSM 7213 TaxID=767817 RepID=R4KSK4_9FIRM|nr:serpin family protein [Desulfoscipio gibsoniae]AGL02566.1 serine protease inhibitor [Desulfoscipio gibsoniae DSM 7213]